MDLQSSASLDKVEKVRHFQSFKQCQFVEFKNFKFKVWDMEKWTGFRGCNSGSRVARAKWSSSADSSYNLQ